MSRNYEGLIVLNTKGAEGSVDELIDGVAKELEAEGAKVAGINPLGRRKFAYSIQHLDAGHYVTYKFTAAPAVIGKIQSRLALNEQVHATQFQRA
jgi:small subunit ribosomal protein S6